LTDIFAHRYAEIVLWNDFGERERRLIVQGFRLLAERICPYYDNGKETEHGKAFWTDIHSRITMELGLKSLSPVAYSYTTTFAGKEHLVSGIRDMLQVCENWMVQPLNDAAFADGFIKERLSLVELGFRRKGEQIAAANAKLPKDAAEWR